MAEPTAKQRRMFAKADVAMPDGSYYIRNADDLDNAIKAVGRATPNAGESDVARRNAVRRHIMKRAAAIKRTDMIPDTWNPDGSLKTVATHTVLGEAFVSDYLAHFGRKGMKWGEHVFGTPDGASRKVVRADRKYAQAAASPSIHVAVWNHSARAMNEIELPRINAKYAGQNPLDNPKVRDQYMKEVTEASLRRLQESADQFGPSKSGNLHLVIEPRHDANADKYGINSYQVRARPVHQARHADDSSGPIVGFITYKRNAQGLVTSADFQPNDSMKQTAVHQGEEFVLEHFGRKGMKWGAHIFGDRGSSSGTSTTVHPDVARARAAQATIQRHGLSAVSNNELRDLNKRTQLETEYARLNTHTSEGKKFVSQFAKESGKGLATGYVQRYGPKGIEWLIKNGIKIAVGSGKHKA